jgi:hypothetical protein
MSHITPIEVEIDSLDAIKQMCEANGWTFNENAKTFRSYNKEKCDHSITIDAKHYEIGIRSKGDKYEFATDSWGTGKLRPIREKLPQMYSEAKVTLAAKKNRFRIRATSVDANGWRVLRLRKSA